MPPLHPILVRLDNYLNLNIGLMSRTTRINIETLLRDDLTLINKGAFAEQFVGQELISYAPFYDAAELHYWSRDKPGSTAEIDYLIQYENFIVPIEVKADKTGTMKSMKIFMAEKSNSAHVPIGIKISQNHLHLRDDILAIPLYLMSE